MRITKEVLNAQVEILNRYTKRSEGERYYIGYENGCTNLFLEVGSGRQTISYGNTKKELSEQLDTIIKILSIEEQRERKIYLLYDRHWGCVDEATTDREKATKKVKELNDANNGVRRYTICTYKDFAVK